MCADWARVTTQLTYHTIYSHLRTHEAAEVVVIDTHGGFEAARLRDVFVGRLRAEPEPPEEADARAVALLDRIKFIRVFDVVGIAQAVQEVADGWAQRDREAEERRQSEAARPGTMVILSSQDDEDEMDEIQASQPYEPPPEASRGGTGMVIIDNIANHFGGELAKNTVQGISTAAAAVPASGLWSG